MPVFFFLSGYLWNLKADGIKEYIHRSIRSLLVPYFLLNIVAAAIMIPIFLVAHKYDEIYNRTLDILIGAAHCFAGPCWFLICLFWIRILMLFTVKTRVPVLIVTFSMASAYVIGKFVWWDISSALAAFPIFYVGYLMKKMEWVERLKTKHWFLILVITLPVLLYVNHINGSVSIYSLTFGNYPWLYY